LIAGKIWKITQNAAIGRQIGSPAHRKIRNHRKVLFGHCVLAVGGFATMFAPVNSLGKVVLYRAAIKTPSKSGLNVKLSSASPKPADPHLLSAGSARPKINPIVVSDLPVPRFLTGAS
jgi:hypothetical protein